MCDNNQLKTTCTLQEEALARGPEWRDELDHGEPVLFDENSQRYYNSSQLETVKQVDAALAGVAALRKARGAALDLLPVDPRRAARGQPNAPVRILFRCQARILGTSAPTQQKLISIQGNCKFSMKKERAGQCEFIARLKMEICTLDRFV